MMRQEYFETYSRTPMKTTLQRARELNHILLANKERHQQQLIHLIDTLLIILIMIHLIKLIYFITIHLDFKKKK